MSSGWLNLRKLDTQQRSRTVQLKLSHGALLSAYRSRVASSLITFRDSFLGCRARWGACSCVWIVSYFFACSAHLSIPTLSFRDRRIIIFIPCAQKRGESKESPEYVLKMNWCTISSWITTIKLIFFRTRHIPFALLLFIFWFSYMEVFDSPRVEDLQDQYRAGVRSMWIAKTWRDVCIPEVRWCIS